MALSSIIRLEAFSYSDVRVSMAGLGNVCVNGIVSITGFGNTVERGTQRGLGSQIQGYTTGLITPNDLTIEMQAGAWDIFKKAEIYAALLSGVRKPTWTFTLFKVGAVLPITLIATDCTFMSDSVDFSAGSDQITVQTVWKPFKCGTIKELAALAIL